MTLQLFAVAGASKDPATDRAYGHRITPPECIDLLCSLPAWRAQSGEALDLGVGAGALCRGIHQRIPQGPGKVSGWVLMDARWEAINAVADWRPGLHVEGHVHDALDPEWPAQHALPHLTRVVANPPWSLLWCTCGAQWLPKKSRVCPTCHTPGQDLAIKMVAAAMLHCPNADIWVLHNADWPFHSERCKFWGVNAPASHKFASREELSGTRVAYGRPDGERVTAHNRPSVLYHWVPTRRFKGQHIGFHSWPLEA